MSPFGAMELPEAWVDSTSPIAASSDQVMPAQFGRSFGRLATALLYALSSTGGIPATLETTPGWPA
ncbi:hypothetical protein GCM10025734_01420 [Kitasatospora paranensis]